MISAPARNGSAPATPNAMNRRRVGALFHPLLFSIHDPLSRSFVNPIGRTPRIKRLPCHGSQARAPLGQSIRGVGFKGQLGIEAGELSRGAATSYPRE